ncbi:MAG: hypothetical protein ABII20_06200 [Candidatus Omnitrophota bacterium]|nr:hypothetical protein [Candidatus Omnitrophota bacterium]MBU2527764.1 hypothetical protein [bacterium]MBU3930436.1 hypothetical protein [bacterium]
MARQWVKKEVRRDPLVSFATAAESFVKEKPQKALSFALGFIAVLILGGLLLSAHLKNRDASYSALLRAGTNIYSNPDFALGLCDKIISEQQHSAKTHALARYIKGDALFIKEDYEGAFKIYSEARPVAAKEIMPNIIYAQGKAKESLSQFNEAMSFYQEFIELHDRHHLALEVYLSMARIFTVTGKPDQAAAYIEVIKGRAQGTKWAQYAENLLPKAEK